jgi:hypothetical protein
VGILHWIFGKHLPKPPDPDKAVEAAWMPIWQAHLIMHELGERDIPAVLSEDHTSHMIFTAREPMARIFVMEPLRAEVEAVIEEITGFPPAHQNG